MSLIIAQMLKSFQWLPTDYIQILVFSDLATAYLLVFLCGYSSLFFFPQILADCL